MLEDYPPHQPGRFTGFLISFLLIVLDGFSLLVLLRQPVSFLNFLAGLMLLLSFPALFVVGFWTRGIKAAHYRVDEGFLFIKWGGVRQIVPTAGIKQILLGRDCQGISGFRGLRWPGLMIGKGKVHIEQGNALRATFYATRKLDGQLLVVTADGNYALSPTDPESFKISLEALPSIPATGMEIKSDLGPFGWPIWHDLRGLSILAAAILLNLLLFGAITGLANRLPAEVPLHFDVAGQADRLGPPVALLMLPLIGLLAWIANLVIGAFFYLLRGEKAMAYLIWAFTILIQVAAWLVAGGLLL